MQISNAGTGYNRTTTTGTAGDFRFTNLPFNPYHLVVSAKGFAPFTQDVDVRSAVPTSLDISLKLGTTSENITVEATGVDLVETEPTDHTDVDRALFDKLPLESASSSVSSLVTLATPGVAADSNGLFHGLGDHASNSFSVDGQPITDQQSKVFSNQIPEDSIQSLEVISGAPPAEYGGKTSLVIVATTRSGLGETEPHGQVTASYGSFGSPNGGFNLGFGGKNLGNFISANGLNTARFLDPPELGVMHDRGNEENIFDRVDYKPSQSDTISLNFNYSRSWFQTPNSYDAQNGTEWTFNAATPICPIWTNRFLRGPGTKRPAGRARGSAFENRNVQYCAIVDACDQYEHRVHARRLGAAGSIQLLPERESLRRCVTRFATVDRWSEPLVVECRSSRKCLVREGNQQHKGGSHLRAHIPYGKRPIRHRRSDGERCLFEC